MSAARQRLAFALDFPSLAEAAPIAEQVAPHVGVLKVGLELFIKEGAAAVRLARELGCGVFLDLKLHDIAKTVERAVGTAAQLGASYLTIHSAGGPGMMEAAARQMQREQSQLKLLAVTVLTSLDDSDLAAVGVDSPAAEQVERLASLARGCGIPGLVCSAQEVGRLRQVLGPETILVTPGIRPRGADVGDQKRVATPADALLAGASLLVVGRPIRDAADPAAAARAILAEMEGAA